MPQTSKWNCRAPPTRSPPACASTPVTTTTPSSGRLSAKSSTAASTTTGSPAAPVSTPSWTAVASTPWWKPGTRTCPCSTTTSWWGTFAWPRTTAGSAMTSTPPAPRWRTCWTAAARAWCPSSSWRRSAAASTATSWWWGMTTANCGWTPTRVAPPTWSAPCSPSMTGAGRSRWTTAPT